MAVVTVPVRLVEANMVDLVTHRRDGRPVHTTVLSTPRGGKLLVRTHSTAGKLKRLRNNPNVLVTACDSRGRPLGQTRPGTARIMPTTDTEACLDLLHRRHGLIGRFATAVRHLRGMQDVFIEISPS